MEAQEKGTRAQGKVAGEQKKVTGAQGKIAGAQGRTAGAREKTARAQERVAGTQEKVVGAAEGGRFTSDVLKRRSREAFDAQAATYDGGMQGDHARKLYPCVEREVVRLVEGMPEGGGQPRLLDMGCGTGALAEQVLDALPGAVVSCLDLPSRMVEAAQARLGTRAEVLLGDAERLPFRDGKFDVVWCNDSFHHYPEPERAAFQAWRTLKPGGAFVVGDVWQPAPARALMNAWMPFSREGDVRIYSEDELRAILRRWFDAVSWRRVGMTACVAVARKGR